MKTVMQRRAEIGLRSLGRNERSQVLRGLEFIKSLTPEEFGRSSSIRRIRSASGERLYVYRATQSLRLIMSIQGDTCTVEDIVDHERLSRLLPSQEQQ